MCNYYDNKESAPFVASRFAAELQKTFDWGPIRPRALAPGVLVNGDGERELVPMQFAFAPPGSRDSYDAKRTLANARVESREKWPWKTAFRRHRCLLPMTSFREPCYWGETAGTEVDFRAISGAQLAAAGLFSVWRSPEGDVRLVTMALLMRPACDYVMDHGHHRQPFFIDESGYDAWLLAEDRDPDETLRVLRDHASDPELTFDTARHMAASWTKRQKAKLASRDEQLVEIEAIGPLGF